MQGIIDGVDAEAQKNGMSRGDLLKYFNVPECKGAPAPCCHHIDTCRGHHTDNRRSKNGAKMPSTHAPVHCSCAYYNRFLQFDLDLCPWFTDEMLLRTVTKLIAELFAGFTYLTCCSQPHTYTSDLRPLPLPHAMATNALASKVKPKH
jgi:hypothetical protein